MSNEKKILIIMVGVFLVTGSVFWQLKETRERFTKYMDSLSGSIAEKKKDGVKDSYNKKMGEVMDVYAPAVEKMRGRLDEEQQKIEEIEIKISELVEAGVVTAEEVLQMTQEEINILIEENISN